MAFKGLTSKDKMETPPSKPSIMRWRGLLADKDKSIRSMVLVNFMVLAGALVFTQCGFIGIGTPGNYVGYLVVILAPIALTALLLGVWMGTLMGLASGLTLFLHALLQPLDYFEIRFFTSVSSIVLMALTGLLMGLLLALALRKEPPLRRRIAYLALACIVMSHLFTVALALNMLAQVFYRATSIASNMGENVDLETIRAFMVSTVGQTGDPMLQAWLDSLLMFVTCLAGDAIVRWLASKKDGISLRTTFHAWLLLVVSVVWALTTAFAFVVITEHAKADAQTNMRSEIDYLLLQLQGSNTRTQALESFFKRDAESEKALSADEMRQLSQLFAEGNVLKGYSKEADGIIAVFLKDTVVLSDDPCYRVGSTLADYIDYDGTLAGILGGTADPNSMKQIIFNEKIVTKDDLDDISGLMTQDISAQVSYLCFGRQGDYTVLITMPASKVFVERSQIMAWTTLLAFVLLAVVFALVSRLLTRVVADNIDATNNVLGEITSGNLEARVDIRDSREFRSLSDGINSTVGALRSWIAEAESRIASELAAAKAIQASALPSTFPPFPSITRFDIFALMNPAKEVGGDFYDFFLLGENNTAESGRLAFVIADVSGKGIPASLFMMAAKTEIRNFVGSGMELGAAIAKVNERLCDGNGANMFVTAFVGIYDYGQRRLTYVNAGHNPTLLNHRGEWTWLKKKSGLPLGIFDGMTYTAMELECEASDELLLYTDGVTEAMNVDDRQYGEERLITLVQDGRYEDTEQMVRAVRADVAQFVGDAEQSDDITILALKLH